MSDAPPLHFYESEDHPGREYPAMAAIMITTAVESDEEFEDLLDTVRQALKHHSRWSVGQGGITWDEAEVKLEWALRRLDRWREQQR